MSAENCFTGGDHVLVNTTSSVLRIVILYGKVGNGNGTMPHWSERSRSFRGWQVGVI